MLSLISVFIIQIGMIENDEYDLKFNHNLRISTKFEIRKVIDSTHGVFFRSLDRVIIPHKCMPLMKMILDMEGIKFFVLSEEEYKKLEIGNDDGDSNTNKMDKSFIWDPIKDYDTPDTIHPNETFGGKTLVVRVNRDTGVIKTSKYDAPLVSFIKSLKKEHRKYNTDTHEWIINDKSTLNHFITQVRKMPALLVEMA